MDRSIIEGNPHAVIEGMIIGAYAIGATVGYVYIRAEYPLAVERLHRALKHARERGFLGENLFGTDYSLKIKVKLGAGAFVCGEETALIASIEGERGMPRAKPPFPANKGLWESQLSLTMSKPLPISRRLSIRVPTGTPPSVQRKVRAPRLLLSPEK
jgi:NADH:ubiquinone oxidoreductase subunit F (NADH-binding)